MLQQFIVITAIPVSLIILPSLWTGPKAATALAREQGWLTSGLVLSLHIPKGSEAR